MTSEKQGQITQLLARWAEGDRSALDSLIPVVYGELRKIAESYLRRERKGHTLQPTALVNEAWLRLAKPVPLSFESRKQLFGLAAQVMRQVLVDYARGARRANGAENVPLNGLEVGACADLDQFLGSGSSHRPAGGFQSPAGSDRRTPIFRWVERRRDRGSARRFACHHKPRAKIGGSLA